MIITTWTVKNQSRSISYSGIRSINFSNGRRTFIDDFNGNNATITLSNANELTFQGDLGDQIRIYPTVNGTTVGSIVFWITAIIYNDEPGTMNNSTITIVAEDSIARLGRIRVNNVTTTNGVLALEQAQTMIQTYGAPISQCTIQGGVSTSSSQTYSGSVADFLRQAMKTEQGWLLSSPVTYTDSTADGGKIYLNGRKTARQDIFTFRSKATSNLDIVYQDLQRNRFYDIFANDVTIDPVGLASQRATNSTSVTSYGNYSVNQGSSDQTTAQAAGLAQYLANVLSDLDLLYFSLSFSDFAQDNSASIYTSFATSLHVFQNYKSVIWWRKPGVDFNYGIQVTMTGYSVSVTPSETVWTCYFTPMSIYNYFILDSTVQGLLNISRLGW